MRRLVAAAALLVVGASAAPASARCYHYEGSPDDVFVCIGRKGKDEKVDREKGQDLCTLKTGKACGPVASVADSCHSKKGGCYDETGARHADLAGY